MSALLRVSAFIDALNNRIGQVVMWLILFSVLVSAANAVIRKIFNVSSNAWLEAQSYMFSMVFLLMGGYVLLHNRHVRVDLIYTRYSPRTKAILNLVGSLLFLLPTAICIVYFSWPQLIESYLIKEMSPDAGGLPRWPIKLMIPVGFALLILQAFSEAIKNAAFLAGKYQFPKGHEGEDEVIV